MNAVGKNVRSIHLFNAGPKAHHGAVLRGLGSPPPASSKV
jgi:hypothetical protein